MAYKEVFIMAVFHNSKEQFYLLAEEFLSEELKRLLDSDNIKLEFYDLCKKFADISLNAPKIKDPKTGEVGGYFQNADISIAKEETTTFVKKYGIVDIDAFMESIHNLHGYAVEFDDVRATSGFMQSESYNYNGGFFGIYYNFQQLPDDIWKTICNEIIKDN